MADIDAEGDVPTAKRIYERIVQAESVFRPYNEFCDRIDRIYGDEQNLTAELRSLSLYDRGYDTFWASMEVLKPAIYAKAPNVVVRPRFSDADSADKVASEMIERALNSELERGHLNEEMLLVRDDLALVNRGVLWITSGDGDDSAVYPEWLDRRDFLHEPARAWRDVSWVARRAWLTVDEAKERFGSVSGDLYQQAFFGSPRDGFVSYQGDGVPDKVAVWEVWDRSTGRVYWVSEGVDDFLDEDDPPLDLDGFWPCPRPAYGTLARRSLVPIPDYQRYEVLLDQIDRITRRIYDLLDEVRMRGLIAGGGEIAEAVEAAMRERSSSSMLINVAGANLLASGGASNMVQWLPLDMLAGAIQGLIEARNQLFADFDRLSGISDIMRGETEAQETLGAQRLKSQYGSIRVQDKKDELARISRDAARIAAEIMCANFSEKELQEVSQIKLPTKAQVSKDIKEMEKASEGEMREAVEQVQQAAMQAQGDPEQLAMIEQQFEQAQRAIAEKYGQELARLSNTVTIEMVMEILRDNRARGLVVDIETDSTVMTDELAEKQVRGEFLTGFSHAIAAVQPLMAAGEQGAGLAGSMLKFALEPFGVSRELAAKIDEFVESAPQIAAAMGGGDGDGVEQGIVEANQKLAEAELQKAQAQTQKVEIDGQMRAFELQQAQQTAEAKAQQDAQRFQLELASTQSKQQETEARIEKILAEIEKLRIDAYNQTRQEDRQEAEAMTRADLDDRKQTLDEAAAVASAIPPVVDV